MVNLRINASTPVAKMARATATITALTGPAGAALEDLSVVGGSDEVQLGAAGTVTVPLATETAAGDPIIWEVTAGRIRRHLDLSGADDDATVDWGDTTYQVLEPPAPSDWVPVQGPPGVVTLAGTAADAGLVELDDAELTVDVPAASDVDIDVSSIGLASTKTEAAILELAAGLASYTDSAKAEAIDHADAVAGAASGQAGIGQRYAWHAQRMAFAATTRHPAIVPAGPPTVAVTNAEWTGAGLDYWPDGSLGFVTVGGTTYAIASNGPVTSVVESSPGDTLGTVIADDIALATLEPADYAAGGPVYHDTGSGKVVMLWHGEDHSDAGFVSFLGLAVADESDLTSWTDLGRVVTTTIDPSLEVQHDLGGGSLAVLDGHLYVYYQDRPSTLDADVWGLSVARAPLADVIAWADGGPAASFAKWHADGWGKPGVGGESTPVLPGAAYLGWCHAVTLTDHDRVLLVWAAKAGPTDVPSQWAVFAALSEPDDPTTFGEVGRIVEPAHRKIAYVTVAAPDYASSNEVAGPAVTLLTVESVSGAYTVAPVAVWSDAELIARTLYVAPGTFLVPGAAAVGAGLTVTGPAVLDDGATINDGATVNGVATVNGDLELVENGAGLNGSVTARSFRPVDVSALPGSVPPGPHTFGQTCRIGGLLYLCIVEGEPGEWAPVGHGGVSDWTNVSGFTNGWASVGGATNTRYRLVGVNEVELLMLIGSGTNGTSAFTLPAGHRPTSTELRVTTATNVLALANVKAATVYLNADGTVVCDGIDGTRPHLPLHTRFIRAL
jgi:hypothetical protein